jgi:hypothetical protein
MRARFTTLTAACGPHSSGARGRLANLASLASLEIVPG